MAETDLVGKLQDELVKIGFELAGCIEEIQQRHAPESAPFPPPGVDPNVHYAEFWAKRYEETPFATRGFQNHEESANQPIEKLKAKAQEIIKILSGIKEIAKTEGIDRSEEEQLEELAKLEKENEAAQIELEQAVEQANNFLGQVATMQRKVAVGALGF
mmetsp:Transcript_1042/g.1677  ORF Transcript_1042/g.1677 Transcript_1042/m.1677 type:complete len:159 (+) Transcript_1042:57-533(+)